MSNLSSNYTSQTFHKTLVWYLHCHTARFMCKTSHNLHTTLLSAGLPFTHTQLFYQLAFPSPTDVMKFDNSYSWTRSKEVFYSAKMLPPDTTAEEDGTVEEEEYYECDGPEDRTVQKGDLRPDEGDTRPDEGDTRPDEDDPRPDEDDPKPDEGDPRPGEGDPRPGEGDPRPGEGDPRPDEGDLRPDDGGQSTA